MEGGPSRSSVIKKPTHMHEDKPSEATILCDSVRAGPDCLPPASTGETWYMYCTSKRNCSSRRRRDGGTCGAKRFRQRPCRLDSDLVHVPLTRIVLDVHVGVAQVIRLW